MADNDLELHVKTTADLAALKQAEDELHRFYAAGTAGPSTFPLAPIPGALTEPGGAFGEGSAGYAGLTHAAAETERIGQAASIAGKNFSSAAFHAGILAKELGSGNINLRSLNVLAHSVGIAYAAAAAAGIAVNKGLSEYTKLLNQSTAELDKQSEAVVNLAKQWEATAKAVLSPEDVQKAAEAGIGEFDKMGKAASEWRQKELTGWQNVIDKVTLGFKQAFTFGGIRDANQAKGAIEQLNDETARGIELDREAAIAAKAHQIELARKTEKEFEGLKGKSSADAVAELTAKIAEQKAKQDELADSGKKMGENEIRAWIEAGQAAALYQKKLDEILKLEEQRKNAADKAYDTSDNNVKGVLANEKAATEARAAGREREADQYAKSAEQYAAGLNPVQQQQLANLREQQRLAYGGPPKPLSDIDANKQAFDAYWARPDVRAAFANQGDIGFMSTGRLGPVQGGAAPKQETSAADEAKWNELMVLLRGN